MGNPLNCNFVLLLELSLQVRMYDLASMTCVYELPGHTDIILCLDTVVFSGHVLLASGSKDHTVSVSQLELTSFQLCLL